jgi:hypothetical protein
MSSTFQSDRAPRNADGVPGPEAGLGSADSHARKPHVQGDTMGATTGWVIFAAAILVLCAIAFVASGTSLVEMFDAEHVENQQAIVPPVP